MADDEVSARPPLPDGLVAFVKQDCPTCVIVAPVLQRLAAAGPCTVYAQDNPDFPASAEWVIDDLALSVSWHHRIETVPTLLRVDDGVETARIEGWSRSEWEQFTGTVDLGPELPDWRPGCGSLSVDPTRTDELMVRYSGSTLRSRRVELGVLEDEQEALFERGWTDGMPVVAPTEARVLRMLEGTTRDADDLVAIVPPDLVECTVEKVAINTVMAGGKPEYLPVVITALQAACTDEFNMHGLLATTMPVGPVLVVNGPIRHEIGMNSGLNLLGQGNRANSTIGRALQLIIRNVGGGAPGGIDRATQGSPSKIGLCFAEDEEGSPWDSLAESRGFRADASTVTLFPGEGPRVLFDQKSRTADSLVQHFAEMLKVNISPKIVMQMDTMLVMAPEHMSRFRDAGWDRTRFLDELTNRLQIDADTVITGAGGIEEGMPAFLAGSTLPKFPPGGIHVVHGGGNAGLFSAALAGWVTGDMGSVTVTKEIVR